MELLKAMTPDEVAHWEIVRVRGRRKFVAARISIFWSLILFVIEVYINATAGLPTLVALFFFWALTGRFAKLGFDPEIPAIHWFFPGIMWDTLERRYRLAHDATLVPLPPCWFLISEVRMLVAVMLFPAFAALAIVQAPSLIEQFSCFTLLALMLMVVASWAGLTLWNGGFQIDSASSQLFRRRGFPVIFFSRVVPYDSIVSIVIAKGAGPRRHWGSWNHVAVQTTTGTFVIRQDQYRPGLLRFAECLSREVNKPLESKT